ncbi:hypothetical protein C9F11_38230 [Streptomyces sp. YIM 121038]|uniref:hypothetical protein n=1 Tax=Streptomyces sp. YIM 121038 TaxID=2136401 RepID=UPI001110B876|nr:hypothetical protein [Streptomyces sp. YIM 121038]QCX81229.1 hypothetical protein C9F11_38230 [Streptomyces sp. YIM 121038]
MAAATRRHRVIQWAVVDGQRDHLNFGLTEGRDRLRSARRSADAFHVYEFPARNGAPLYVAYARFLPGSAKHGFSRFDPDLDVAYVFELTAEAVIASFGLGEREVA